MIFILPLLLTLYWFVINQGKEEKAILREKYIRDDVVLRIAEQRTGTYSKRPPTFITQVTEVKVSKESHR